MIKKQFYFWMILVFASCQAKINTKTVVGIQSYEGFSKDKTDVNDSKPHIFSQFESSKIKNSIFAAEMKTQIQHNCALIVARELRSGKDFPIARFGRCNRFYEE